MKYNLAQMEYQIYQEFDNLTIPVSDTFHPLDTMEWNHYGSSTYMFLPTTLVDTLRFDLLPPKVGGYKEWTFEIRMLKEYNLNEGLFDMPGFITITALNNGGVNIKLGTDLIGFDTSAFMQLDVWIHLTLMSEPGLSTTTLYINSQPLADIPQRTTLPSSSQGWFFPNNNVAIKEMRIWSEIMPLTFLKQATLKDFDGCYYPNLFYFLPMRSQQDRALAARRYTMGTYEHIWQGGYRGVSENDFNYCYDVQEVFDGFSCNSQQYVHLLTNDFTNLQFPLFTPGSPPPPLPTWTLEFWLLFMRGTDIGNIVNLKMGDGSSIAYSESARKVYYKQYSSGNVLVYSEQAYDSVMDLDFTRSYWKKVVVRYESVPSLACSVEIVKGGTKVHGQCLGSGAPKWVTFCEGNGPCNFAVRHVIMWSKIMSYSPRSPPIYAELSSLVAYWPLDDKESPILRDASPRALTYPILALHPTQSFRWKHPHQISPTADHLFICLDPSSLYNELTELCEPLNVLTPAFYPSTTPVTLKSNQMGPLSKDWTIDFWVKYTSERPFSQINFITQKATSCTNALAGGVVLNIGVLSGGSGSQSMKAEDLADVMRVPNVHTSIIIKPLRYFHYTLINSGAANKLQSVLNFTNPNDIQPSFDFLSPCDFQIGLETLNDPSISFSLKQLKVWSVSMNIGEIMHWSMATMVNQGYPNLVLYYRMDNDIFKGKFNSKHSSKILI
ncbi:hypothetical protein FGO68_gene12907 [Halteria grandinella]|uniref:Uncharacterized protein n=1 Tax=Halteria grandinella TaxID=5974 RepID=A0A8J8SUF9_HALGN|nr:hypothetical protein FGO68_gene12907 [Halteria grandinella]